MGYQEFMYLAIGIAVLLLAIFGSIALFYLILILRDASKVVEKVKDTTEKVNEYILSPIRVANTLIERFKPYYDSFLEKKDEVMEKHKPSKKKKA